MERKITIIYGEDLKQTYETIVLDNQKTKKLINNIVKELKIRKKVLTRRKFGYKLLDAKTGKDIGDDPIFLKATYEDVFLLVPDEVSISSVFRDICALPLAFIFAVVQQSIRASGIILGGIPTALLGTFLLILPDAMIYKSIKNKIAHQNEIIINNHLLRSKAKKNADSELSKPVVDNKSKEKNQKEEKEATENKEVVITEEEAVTEKEKKDIKTDVNKKEVERTFSETAQKVLFCRKCGAELIENGLFCNKCGTKVIIPEE